MPRDIETPRPETPRPEKATLQTRIDAYRAFAASRTSQQDRAIEVSEWCMDQVGKQDIALLGAFENTMRARGIAAAKRGFLNSAFEDFMNEPAP